MYSATAESRAFYIWSQRKTKRLIDCGNIRSRLYFRPAFKWKKTVSSSYDAGKKMDRRRWISSSCSVWKRRGFDDGWTIFALSNTLEPITKIRGNIQISIILIHCGVEKQTWHKSSKFMIIYRDMSLIRTIISTSLYVWKRALAFTSRSSGAPAWRKASQCWRTGTGAETKKFSLKEEKKR